MDRWIDGWMDGWMDEWMDGWIDVCVCVLVSFMRMYIDKFQFVISPFCSKQKNTLYPGWWEQPWDIWVDQKYCAPFPALFATSCYRGILTCSSQNWRKKFQESSMPFSNPCAGWCWLENDGNQWFSVIWGALPRKLSRGQCLRDRVSLQVSAFVTSFQYWPKENWDACSLKRGDMIVISGWLCQSVCQKD